MSEKDPNAFRTISEVADFLNLPQHVLRFWETKFHQLKPVKNSGGRRLYRPGDVQLLQNVKSLLYEQGYTIKGVQRLFREKRINNINNDIATNRKPRTELQSSTSLPDGTSELYDAPLLHSLETDGLETHINPDGILNDETPSLKPNISQGTVSKQNYILLQTALNELNQCKKLLDETRK